MSHNCCSENIPYLSCFWFKINNENICGEWVLQNGSLARKSKRKFVDQLDHQKKKGMWSFLCFCCFSFTCMYVVISQSPTSSAPNELTKQSLVHWSKKQSLKESYVRIVIGYVLFFSQGSNFQWQRLILVLFEFNQSTQFLILSLSLSLFSFYPW